MIVYILMFLLSIVFMHLANKQENVKRKNIFYVLSFMTFFLVSAFRYGVGTDYLRRYVYDYGRILEGIHVSNLEVGFQLLMKGTMLLSDKPFLMFFITSLMINGFVFYTLVKESKDKILSICIYFFLGFFFDSLNIMRQYLAISFVFIGYYYLLKNKRLLFVISVLLASLFHSTALIMIILVLCSDKVLCSYKWFIPCIIAVLCLNTNLMNILEFFLQNTRFNVYFSGKLFKGETSYLFILENLAFYLLMIYIRNKGYIKHNDKKAILFLNTQALALLCMCLGTCHMLFIRIAFYFSIFQMLSIPYYLAHYKKTYMISLRNKSYHINIVKALVICCMMVAFFRTNIQSNVNEVVPYRTIFTREWKIY